MPAGGIFFLFIGVIGFFFCVYIGGCVIAAKEAGKFMARFKQKVRLNEINGISMEDLTDALEGRRIFWMGPDYDAAKRRKAAVDALKTAAPEASEPNEIDISALELAVREADLVGVPMLHMPGDRTFGHAAMARANAKLRAAKRAQGTRPAHAAASASSAAAAAAPPGAVQRRSSHGSSIGGRYDGPVPSDVAEPRYTANKPRTRDAMEGRSAPSSHQLDIEAIDGADTTEEDFQMRVFEEEIKAAEQRNDPNVAKLLQLASYKHLDSYRIPAKLLDAKGRVTDPLRALYMICEAKGILHSYHQASRTFARRIVRPAHSIPFLRLMEYGWQPTVSHTDFAGILNANALYSFTVGFPQLFFTLAFIASNDTSGTAVTCASSKCTVIEDFQKPNVQLAIVVASLGVGIISLLISIVNIVVDFPAQLFDIAEKEDESLHFTLQAEHATKTWEDKLAVEVQENVKVMLKKSTQFEDNLVAGMEAPSLVIDDVMRIERAAMEKKVAYIEHFLTMSEDEKKLRSDLRSGKRKKKAAADDSGEGESRERELASIAEEIPTAPAQEPADAAAAPSAAAVSVERRRLPGSAAYAAAAAESASP